MPNFTITLTQAQVDRLKAVIPGVTATEWQNWLKQQLRTEILKRETLKAKEAQVMTVTTAVARAELELAEEGWE